uniref:Uncharacterized protein n=1 Tax=Kalanchoe fedtschenkoi TaxID=63787 RepID=A0A7N0UTP0_KALFE
MQTSIRQISLPARGCRSNPGLDYSASSCPVLHPLSPFLYKFVILFPNVFHQTGESKTPIKISILKKFSNNLLFYNHSLKFCIVI